MYSGKILLIDDNQEHLNLASRALSKSGFFHQAIKWTSEHAGKDYFSEPQTGIRLVFSDINLEELRPPNEKQLSETLAITLRNLVSPNNGPYALIFWSRNRALIEAIREHLSTRHGDILAPIAVYCIDKQQIPDLDDDETTGESIAAFTEKLNEVMANLVPLRAFFSWEELCAQASAKVSNTLAISSSTTTDWSSDTETSNLSALSYLIAKEAVGPRNLNDKEDKAFIAGITPLLEDMLHSSSSGEFQNLIKECIQSQNGQNSTIDTALLNTAYHIDTISPSLGSRGVLASIKTDDRIFQRIFHHRWSEIFPEFWDYGFYTNYKEKCQQVGEPIINSREVKGNSICGLIEISPSCDEAQKKNRNRKLVLSLLVPDEYSCVIGNSGSHQGIHTFPTIYLNNRKYSLRSNFRYVTGLEENHEIFNTPLLRVREQLLNELIFSYGKYSSRPGSIAFY